MIRFACPGCGANFAVDDSKAGKLGTCPTCRSRFQIPGTGPPPEPASVPAPTPPAAGTPAAPVEIDPCPGCGMRLTVAGASVGRDVECPSCKTIFRAVRRVEGDSPLALAEEEPARTRRSRRRRRDDEDDYDDDRPRRRRPREESKRVLAGILAIVVGWLGIHKFVLGYTNAGIIMLVLGLCTGVTWVIGLVEGIIYLTKTDEEFIEIYQRGCKEWF